MLFFRSDGFLGIALSQPHAASRPSGVWKRRKLSASVTWVTGPKILRVKRLVRGRIYVSGMLVAVGMRRRKRRYVSVRVRIAVVRMAVERRVEGEVREVVNSEGVDGRSDLRVEMVFVVWVRRVEVVFWALLRRSERFVVRMEDSSEGLEEDQGLYHGIVVDVVGRAHPAQIGLGVDSGLKQ